MCLLNVSRSSNRRHGVCYMFTKYDKTLDLFDHFLLIYIFHHRVSGQGIIHKNIIKEYVIWQLAIYFLYTLRKYEQENYNHGSKCYFYFNKCCERIIG